MLDLMIQLYVGGKLSTIYFGMLYCVGTSTLVRLYTP